MDAKINGESDNKVIGVIGGMGPQAGLDFYQKVLDATDADYDQQNLPVILASLPNLIPDRSNFIMGRSNDDPGPVLIDIMRRLQRAGASHICMPCVTAHHPMIVDRLRSACSEEQVTFVGIIDATISRLLEEFDGERPAVAALSTTATFKTRIILNRLAEAGFSVVEQDLEIQDSLVQTAIMDPGFGIKSFSNPVTNRAKENLTKAIDHLRDKGAKAVILGCTELPVAIHEKELNGVTLIDPTAALVSAVTR